MNPKIRELAQQAGLLVYNPDGRRTKLEHFAELIVQQCIEVVEQAVIQREPASTYVKKIKTVLANQSPPQFRWPEKACPCGPGVHGECLEVGCMWERDPSLVPQNLRLWNSEGRQ